MEEVFRSLGLGHPPGAQTLTVKGDILSSNSAMSLLCHASNHFNSIVFHCFPRSYVILFILLCSIVMFFQIST